MSLRARDREVVERLLREEGLRPVIDAIAEVCLDASGGALGIFLFPEDDDPLEPNVLRTVHDHLRGDLF